MKLKALILVAAASVALVSTAQARSCSEQGRLCKQWARDNLSQDPLRMKSAQAVCAGEVGQCIARCNNGQKWFVGIGGSNQYAIDTCR